MIRFHTSLLVQAADLDQAEFFVPADDRRIGAGGTLIAANPRGPGVEVLGYPLQHAHLPIEAALVGIRLIDRPAVDWGNKGDIVLYRLSA